MKEAIGGMFSNTSAYFLIYLSDEAVQKLGFRETPEDLNNLKSFIPPQLLVFLKNFFNFFLKFFLFDFFRKK